MCDPERTPRSFRQSTEITIERANPRRLQLRLRVRFDAKNSLAGSAALGAALSASNAARHAVDRRDPVRTATAIKLDGAFTEAVWEQRARDQRLPPARSQGRRSRRPSRPTCKVVYDASNLYVAVRAHDPEPARLVGLRTRRDTDSSSDWIKVIVDSFHDRRTAFEFGVNPGRREGRPLLVQRRERRQRLGRGVGRRRLARQRRLARRVPHSVLAAPLPSVRQRRRSASPSSARSAG